MPPSDLRGSAFRLSPRSYLDRIVDRSAQGNSASDDAALLAARWVDAVRRADVRAALLAIYDDCSAEIARRGPTCWTSGKCCNFRDYGHLLYVTGLETAYLVEGLSSAPATNPAPTPQSPVAPPVPAASSTRSLQVIGPGSSAFVHPPRPAHSFPALSQASLADALVRGGCPFQAAKLCGVHALRPLGCRIYFCDQSAQGWQQDLSEALLARIRALHDQFNIPYRYGEWRAMLQNFVDVDRG